ncbi:hypothetical protein [Phenylobacterium sp.]
MAISRVPFVIASRWAMFHARRSPPMLTGTSLTNGHRSMAPNVKKK